MDWQIEEIAAITGASVIRWPNADRVKAAKVHQGPGTLYFPLTGEPDEGTLQSLTRVGASGIVLYAGRPAPWADNYPKLGILTHPSPPEAYIKLAAAARDRTGGPVIGLTGSSGKTSTKDYIAAILESRYQVRSTIGSFNLRSDGAGILLSLEGHGDEAAVIEMGFGGMGDIDRMAAMARPSAGVITNITRAHLDGSRGSWEVLVQEKGKLGAHIGPDGVLALNADDPGCNLMDRSQYRCHIVTFGTGPNADVQYTDVTTDERGTALTLTIFGVPYPARLRTYGHVQAANAAAAAAVAGHGFGFTPDEIVAGLERVEPLPRRFQIHSLSNGLTVIDDTWSASIDAMMHGVRNAAAVAGDRRRIAALSGVVKLGDVSRDLHLQVGRLVAGHGYAELFLIEPGEQTAAIREGALEGGLEPDRIHEVTKAELAAALAGRAAADTLFYCKANQGLHVGPMMDDFLAQLKSRSFEPLPS